MSQFSSVTQSCLTLCEPMNCSTPGLPLSITSSQSLLKFMPIELVMPSSRLILCRPLLLLPPIPPSIRVLSNKSALHMRWPKYWSFSFSISPSSEHPGLIKWVNTCKSQKAKKYMFLVSFTLKFQNRPSGLLLCYWYILEIYMVFQF